MTDEPTGELREQVESALIRSGVWPLAVAERAADALLSGPLAPPLAKLKAVEELAADFDDGSEWGTATHPGYEVRNRIRRALDAS